MRKFIFAMFMVSLLAAMTFAQSTTGSLVGTVSGPDGLLPGATVTVTDNLTGRDLVAVTGESGNFRFEKLNFGTYTVRVTADGFKTFIANEVKIDVNREYSLKPILEIGTLEEQVIVQAGADIINSTDSSLSSTVSPRQVLDLPINGRNPLALLNLQAGVNATSSSINGQRSSSVNYTRDGINVQDNFIRTGGFVQDRPTVDNTGEFTVITQNAGAELGGGGSAQVRLVTPRGGNEFHGAGFIYNRNSEFAANEFGNNATNTERPFLNRNQFGGKLSGPLPFPGFGQGTPVLVKDKANFFLSYERFLLRQTSPQTRNVLLARDGTFTYQATDGTIRTVNILSGAGLTGAIPAANGGSIGIDPTIQARFLSLTPTTGNGIITNANRTTTGAIVQPLTQQFLFNQANNDTRNNFASRIDYDFNDRNSIYFSYNFNNNADDRTDADGGFQFQPFVIQGGPTQFYLLSYTTVIGSSFTNEVRGAYNQSDPFFNQSPNFPGNFLIGGLPLGLSSAEPSFQSQGRFTDQYTFQDNASYVIGNHSMRFGIDFNAQRINSQTNFNQVPVFNITTTGNTNTPGLAAGLFPGGISAADRARADALRFLLGGFVGGGSVQANFVNPTTGRVIGVTDVNRFEYETYGLYFTDQWRATSNLTLNLGLRYDYFAPLRNPDQAFLEPDLTGASGLNQIRSALTNPNGRYVLLGNNAGQPGTFFKGDKNNFGPVVGFAYTPEFGGILGSLFGKEKQTVLRGGFRMGYINDEYVRSADNAAGGNQGLDQTVTARNAAGSTQLNARFNSLPNFTLPPFTAPPISFQTGTLNAGNFFNTVFAINPDLEVQQNMEYTFGIQREIGFDTAIELRYVGGRSNSLVRGLDYNQVDVTAGGFLRDFLIARNNCIILAASQGQTLGENGCRTAGGQLNATGTQGLPGQIPLTTLGNLPFGGFLTNGAIVPAIVAGNAADLAITYIINGLDLERDAAGNLTGNGINFRANPNAGPVDLLDNSGRYRYNSLQFEIRRRFTDGLSFQANYTFQKTLADVLTDGQARFDPFLDNNNQALEYARTDYDRTHTVNINANYELPFGKGKRFFNQGGLTNALLGGFQVNSIINISSGVPISIKDINGTLNRIARSNRQTAVTNLSPDQIKDLIGIFKQPNGKILLIDPSVICPNGSAIQNNVLATANSTCSNQVFFRAQPGQTGNLPRNFINGPMYFNWDAGLIKNIAFNERFRVQLRADAFNVLNTVNFFVAENSAIFDIDSTTFGEISPASTYSPRIMQFAVRLEF